MSTAPKRHITPEEYLALERKAEFKSEYYKGEVFAMAGASVAHALIVSNIVRELGTQLRSKNCFVYSNDVRVHVATNGLYTYPDVVVVCGDQRFLDAENDTLTNPTVLVEILSKSTEAYDRGKKFELYRGLPSLQDYILISQERFYVERYTRQLDDSWLYSSRSSPSEQMPISSISCSLPLEEIYSKTKPLENQ